MEEVLTCKKVAVDLSETIKNHAFFENGIYESVLEEILEAQKNNPEIICYIQPYKSSTILFLKENSPNPNNPIPMYMSTTSNLGIVSYMAEIIHWKDKRELYASRPARLAELNQHIKEFQPGEGDIYRYNQDGKVCVNLIAIHHLKKLQIPFTVGILIKVSDETPLKPRTQAGGWSEVYQFSHIEKPLLQEDVDEDLEKRTLASKYISRQSREERFSLAKKLPEQIQIISRGFKRNANVIIAVLERANGVCERCHQKAPFFRKKDNTPYLEVHHIKMLADDGEDTVENTVAVCPNCHRKLHFGV